MKCSMYFPSCFDSSSTYFYFAINTPAALRRLVLVLWWPDLLLLHGSTVTAGTVTVLSSSVLVSARNGTQAVQQQWETVISGHCWLLRGHRSWRINHEYVGHSVTDSFCTEQNCFDIKWSMSNSPLSYHFQFCCVVLVGIKYLMISIM